MYREHMELLLKIITFPFSSLECYKKDYIEILAESKNYKDYWNTYKKEFQEVLYSSLNKKYSLHTLDYVDMVVQKYFNHSFINGRTSEEVYLYLLSRFAKSFICHRNGRLALKYWESQNDEDFIGPYKGINKIALWNTLNRMICTDLIVITYLLDNGMTDVTCLKGYYTSIMLEDLQLEKILTKGVAETHIHKNAGINFSISWNCLMDLSIVKDEHYKEYYIVNPLYQEEEMKLTIGVTSIMRLLMVHFLSLHGENFYQYLRKYNDINEDEGKLVCAFSEKFQQGEIFHEMEISFYDVKSVWEYLKQRLDVRGDEDYIDRFLESSKLCQTTGENIFLFESMKYMKEEQPDPIFSKVFFQYIKIRNVVFEAKVQTNQIKGLKNFQPYYKRSVKIGGYDSVDYWLLLMNSQFQNKHLKKLEFRFGFDGTRKNLKKILISFLTAYEIFLEQYRLTRKNVQNPPQVGLIFHMLKHLDEDWYEKCWQNTYELNDKKDKQRELFYNVNQEHYKKQIEVFQKLRTEIPGLDRFLIGIDAASIEDDTEPWVFAPVYRSARHSGDRLLFYKNGDEVQTLGFTFHVGEDFRYILTGLRHVDEVIEHFSYHAGDRIGHGIVLGVDPQYWCERNQIIMLPRGEYLDDLLWVWGVCKEGKGLEYLDITYLEQKIMQLTEEIFSCIDGITVYMLWKAYQAKFNFFKPDEKFCYDMQSGNNRKVFCKYIPQNYKEFGQHWSYETLLYVQHCKCYVERMLEPIQIEINVENINFYSYLQKLLLDKINNRGIIIETNPTSNLAIGEMKDLFHHYIFNLNQVEQDKKYGKTIISINSDDPSVFNTNVSNEIAYIFYALQKNGYSREDALHWIDKIRNYGMKSSFLQDDEISWDNLKERIKEVLQQLKG